MRATRLVALLAIPAQVVVAQQSAPSQLSLEDAIGTARRSNPGYLQTANTIKSADANVRATYGALLPRSDASISTRYQQGGTQFFQGAQIGGSGDTKQSGYNLNVSYGISAAALYAPKAARASRSATEASIVDGAESLRAAVTLAYISTLQARATAALQDTLVQTAQGQLELAKAKVAVGAGTTLDIRRAEVALGQAQVATITAHNTAEVEALRLYQNIGIPKPATVDLTTRFTIATPTFSLDSVLDLARRVNPALNSLRSNEYSATMQVKVARTAYTPTLSVGTGWAGNSSAYLDPEFLIGQQRQSALGQQRSCFSQDSLRTRVGLPSLGCNGITFTDADAEAIRASNNAKFPFKFTRSPLGIGASLSIPVFNGFQRENQVQAAQVAKENATYSVRARELQLTTDVTQAYLNLIASTKTVALREQIAGQASEELTFAQERYRVGAATFLDVTTSHGQFQQALIDRVNAIYDYHKAFATLESAVGRPLR
jgi:outer membrane protein